MTTHPFASVDEMEKKLLSTGWKREASGWVNKDQKEFGPAVYTTRAAFVLQLDKEQPK